MLISAWLWLWTFWVTYVANTKIIRYSVEKKIFRALTSCSRYQFITLTLSLDVLETRRNWLTIDQFAALWEVFKIANKQFSKNMTLDACLARHYTLQKLNYHPKRTAKQACQILIRFWQSWELWKIIILCLILANLKLSHKNTENWQSSKLI